MARGSPPTSHFHPIKNPTDGTCASRWGIVPRNDKTWSEAHLTSPKVPRQASDHSLNPQVLGSNPRGRTRSASRQRRGSAPVEGRERSARAPPRWSANSSGSARSMPRSWPRLRQVPTCAPVPQRDLPTESVLPIWALGAGRVGLARHPWLQPSAPSGTASRPHTAPMAVPVEDGALRRAYRPEILEASHALTMLTLGTIEHLPPHRPTSSRRESPRSMPGG